MKHITKDQQQEFDQKWTAIQEGTIRFNDPRMTKINHLLMEIADNKEKYITSYDEICTSMLKRLHRELQRVVFGKVFKTGFTSFS